MAHEIKPDGPSAWRRPWPFVAPVLDDFPALSESRVYSVQTLTALHGVAGALEGIPELSCLAAAGSLGRLEAMPDSDLDLIVVADDSLDPDGDAARQLMEQVWETLEPLELKLPKSWGIFTRPATPARLLADDALGSMDEAPMLYGKRMQLLLDSLPFHGEPAFEALCGDLLSWFAQGTAQNDFPRAHLVTELLRYYRSYCAWQRFKMTAEDDDNWHLRQAKLAFSRRLMVHAMLLGILEESRSQSTGARVSLTAWQRMTPIEALVSAALLHPMEGIAFAGDLLACYERFQSVMNDRVHRAELLASGPTAIDDLDEVPHPAFAPLLAAAEDFGDRLSTMVLRRLEEAAPAVRRAFVVGP